MDTYNLESTLAQVMAWQSQSIVWAVVDQYLCHDTASPGHNELTLACMIHRVHLARCQLGHPQWTWLYMWLQHLPSTIWLSEFPNQPCRDDVHGWILTLLVVFSFVVDYIWAPRAWCGFIQGCCSDIQEQVRNNSAFNTLRQRQNGRHFADDTFKYIFLNENVRL